ncbi:hypothetical protein MHYP_G00056790 [Metynnis hypsauchen]
MHGGKRGLVAPQNTFLENIVRRSSVLSDAVVWFGGFDCAATHSLTVVLSALERVGLCSLRAAHQQRSHMVT